MSVLGKTNITKHRSARLRRIGLAALGFVSVTVTATPALAQDEDNFSGFRVEGFVGWDNSGVNFQDDAFDEGRTSQDGLFYGIGAGYDFRFGAAVVGVEAEFSGSSAGKEETVSGVIGVEPFVADANIDAGQDIYVGLRAGGLVLPQLLLYVKGGYTHFTIDIDGDGTYLGAPFTFDDGLSFDGIRVGAGGEYAFTPNLFAKAEYRYSNYNNGDLDLAGQNIDSSAVFDHLDVDRHQVVLGFGYRF